MSPRSLHLLTSLLHHSVTGFVHVSRRLRYVLDADRRPGDRVTAVTLNDTPIVDGRSYVTGKMMLAKSWCTNGASVCILVLTRFSRHQRSRRLLETQLVSARTLSCRRLASSMKNMKG
eukprot:scaffold7723_cov277-Pinguiococcus_pyrenoidosus.AAC.3